VQQERVSGEQDPALRFQQADVPGGVSGEMQRLQGEVVESEPLAPGQGDGVLDPRVEVPHLPVAIPHVHQDVHGDPGFHQQGAGLEHGPAFVDLREVVLADEDPCPCGQLDGRGQPVVVRMAVADDDPGHLLDGEAELGQPEPESVHGGRGVGPTVEQGERSIVEDVDVRRADPIGGGHDDPVRDGGSGSHSSGPLGGQSL
jgi:hypothetical protein